MEELTIEELKGQAIRQRQSGASYISIGNYLKSTGASQKDISEVISHLDLLEKEKMIEPISQKNRISFQSGFMGAALITLGTVLAWVLWGKGWVATLPIFIIGTGLSALGGAFGRRS